MELDSLLESIQELIEKNGATNIKCYKLLSGNLGLKFKIKEQNYEIRISKN